MIGTPVILYNQLIYKGIDTVFSVKLFVALQLLTPVLDMCNLLRNK